MSYSGKTLDTSLFWQNGIRRNKRAPCVAVWKPVVAATVAAAALGAVHRLSRLCAAATSCREQLRAVPQYWLKLQPHCSLLAWTRGLRNNQRARLVVVVEDVAAVIWMGLGGGGLEGL